MVTALARSITGRASEPSLVAQLHAVARHRLTILPPDPPPVEVLLLPPPPLLVPQAASASDALTASTPNLITRVPRKTELLTHVAPARSYAGRSEHRNPCTCSIEIGLGVETRSLRGCEVGNPSIETPAGPSRRGDRAPA